MELDIDALQLFPGQEAQLFPYTLPNPCTYTCAKSCRVTGGVYV